MYVKPQLELSGVEVVQANKEVYGEITFVNGRALCVDHLGDFHELEFTCGSYINTPDVFSVISLCDVQEGKSTDLYGVLSNINRSEVEKSILNRLEHLLKKDVVSGKNAKAA